MTVATHDPEAFEALARSFDVEFDRLGELNESGLFEVTYDGRTLVDIDLHFLHEACPQMQLETDWTWAQEKSLLQKQRESEKTPGRCDLIADFAQMLASEHLCSREKVARRFDHEVQGRTLKRPFSGATQESAQDGSLLSVPEAQSYVALGHGLAPWRADIHESTLCGLDEALRSAVLAGLRWETAGLLDNFSWPDPLPSSARPQSQRILWRLLRSCEILSQATRSWGLPFISGKDSMKNNAGGVDVCETLVISAVGSAVERAKVPGSYFTRANDVVFWLPPLRSTLRDSVWERVTQKRHAAYETTLLRGDSRPECDRDLEALLSQLRTRHQAVAQTIDQGLLRAARDVSEGGLLMSVFEMCLGRQMGLQWERNLSDGGSEEILAEGLGAYVFTCDVHQISEIEKLLPEARRLGVVMRPFRMRFGRENEIELQDWRRAYLQKGEEGFWS